MTIKHLHKTSVMCFSQNTTRNKNHSTLFTLSEQPFRSRRFEGLSCIMQPSAQKCLIITFHGMWLVILL